MACAQLDDVLKASPEKTNYDLLSRLLICAGTKVMRRLLDYIVPDLPKTLADPIVKARLNKMKTKKILNTMQWDKLFPAPGSFGKSDDFDITLLFQLLREKNISNLTPPPSGWDRLPNSTDYTIQADLARLKYYRNQMVHAEKMETDDVDFNTYWDQIEGSLLRIVKFLPDGDASYERCKKDIRKFRTSPLTDDCQKYADALLAWVQGSEITVKTVVKLVTTGAWVAGSAFILNRYIDDPKTLISLVQKVVMPVGCLVVAIMKGSIKIVLQIEEVEALEELWERYETGQLQRDLEKVLVTEELRQLAKGDDVELTVSISEAEYQSARHYLIGSRAAEGPGWEPGKEELVETGKTVGTGFHIVHGESIRADRHNKFQAHLALIKSEEEAHQVLTEFKKDDEFSQESYHIWAFRIYDESRKRYVKDHDDAEDNLAGARLSKLLEVTGAMNVIVIVTRWRGESDLGLDVYQYITNSSLDLLESCELIEDMTPIKREGLLEKLEKYIEGIKLKAGMLYQATEKKERPTRSDQPPEIFHGDTIKDRKSTFQAHLAYIHYEDQVDQVLAELKKDRKIEKAKYNIRAYRIFDEESKSYIEDSDDDGENMAGGRLLHLLQVSNVENVIVIVTRWHGEVPLGADRFRHINKCATDLLHSQGLTGAQASTEQKETKGKRKSKKSK